MLYSPSPEAAPAVGELAARLAVQAELSLLAENIKSMKRIVLFVLR